MLSPVELKYCSINQIYSSYRNRLYIPDFQRVYEWSKENSINFVDSILSSIKEGRCVSMGILSIVESLDDDRYYLIDGQQRYVTFIILCRVLYDKMRSIVPSSDIKSIMRLGVELDKLHCFLYSFPICYERDSIDSYFMKFFLREDDKSSNDKNISHYDYRSEDIGIKSNILKIYDVIYKYIEDNSVKYSEDVLFRVVDSIFYSGEIGSNSSPDNVYVYFGKDLVRGSKDDAYSLYFGINTIRQDFSDLQKIKLSFFTKIDNFDDRNSFGKDFDNMCYRDFGNEDNLIISYIDYIFKTCISSVSNAYPKNKINEKCISSLSSGELSIILKEMFIGNNIREYKSILNNSEDLLKSVFSVNNEVKSLYCTLNMVHLHPTNHFYCVFIKIAKEMIESKVDYKLVEEYFNLLIIYYVFIQLLSDTSPANHFRETIKNVLGVRSDINAINNIIKSDISKICSSNDMIKEKMKSLLYGKNSMKRNLIKVILSVNSIDNLDKDYYCLLYKEINNLKSMQLDHKCAQGLFSKYNVSNEVGNCIGNLKLCGERLNKSKGCSNDYNTEENVSELIMKDFDEEYNKFVSSRLLHILGL